MEVFRRVTPNEKEFVEVVVGIIDTLQDSVRESIGMASSQSVRRVFASVDRMTYNSYRAPSSKPIPRMS